jgi:hypothetical protein
MDHDVLATLLDWVRSRYFGKYRGTVVSNQDKTKKGRLHVKVPALGDAIVWAMPCVPYAGKGVGLLALPPEKSGVWVEFEGGDPSFPIWTGCFWADGEAPENAAPDIKVWKTDSHTVRLDDTAGEMLLDNGDARVQLASDVTAEAGEAKLTVGPEGVIGELGPHKIQASLAAASLIGVQGALAVS